jgi:hypothetical protein
VLGGRLCQWSSALLPSSGTHGAPSGAVVERNVDVSVSLSSFADHMSQCFFNTRNNKNGKHFFCVDSSFQRRAGMEGLYFSFVVRKISNLADLHQN